MVSLHWLLHGAAAEDLGDGRLRAPILGAEQARRRYGRA